MRHDRRFWHGSWLRRVRAFIGAYPYPPNPDLLRSFLNPSPLLPAHMNCIPLNHLIWRSLYLPILDLTDARLLKRLRLM